MARLRRTICRRLLLRALGFKGEKMPRGFSGHFEKVPVYSYGSERREGADPFDYKAYFLTEKLENYLGCFDIVVKPTPEWSGTKPNGGLRCARKSSQHRIFVVCDCGREVPAGRMHQHVCKKS